LNSSKDNSPERDPPETDTLRRILDLARWAPSGDNTQPWRFEILSGRHLVVHGSDTRRTVLYDRDGFASQIAVGALLEHIVLAAGGYGLRAEISCRPSSVEPDEHPSFDVRFAADPSLRPDPLFAFIEKRCVNRRPLGGLPLTPEEKASVEGALGPPGSPLAAYRPVWFEGGRNKRAMARIAQSSGKLRLILPEAYPVHRAVIEWNARFSVDRIPDRALGLSPSILPLMRWVMGRWERVVFFNRFLGGTLIPRLELDILPALFCSAHFVLLAPKPPRTLADYVDAGRALCRFWLGVSALGLQFQPEMTPLIFRSYAVRGKNFSRLPDALSRARKIGGALDRLVGSEAADRAVFLGRVGRGEPPASRSLRLSLSQLLPPS
jgi:hypothetical protein